MRSGRDNVPKWYYAGGLEHERLAQLAGHDRLLTSPSGALRPVHGTPDRVRNLVRKTGQAFVHGMVVAECDGVEELRPPRPARINRKRKQRNEEDPEGADDDNDVDMMQDEDDPEGQEVPDFPDLLLDEPDADGEPVVEITAEEPTVPRPEVRAVGSHGDPRGPMGEEANEGSWIWTLVPIPEQPVRDRRRPRGPVVRGMSAVELAMARGKRLAHEVSSEEGAVPARQAKKGRREVDPGADAGGDKPETEPAGTEQPEGVGESLLVLTPEEEQALLLPPRTPPETIAAWEEEQGELLGDFPLVPPSQRGGGGRTNQRAPRCGRPRLHNNQDKRECARKERRDEAGSSADDALQPRRHGRSGTSRRNWCKRTRLEQQGNRGDRGLQHWI